MPGTLRVGIFGAGAIGCYVGGRLVAGGQDVIFVGRPRMGEELARHGLALSDHEGGRWTVPATALVYSAEPASLSACDVVLVTVKSGSTKAAVAELAPVLQPGTLVISLQNGIRNADLLRKGLTSCTVLAGMVPFNVTAHGEGRFHQGSEGILEIASDPAVEVLASAFAVSGFPVRLQQDMAPIQWAKLLFNLNNPINALANCPLLLQLSRRSFRRCLALAQDEALHVLSKAGITPARLTPVPTRWVPFILRLPDVLYAVIARNSLTIDPLARSSMSDDLAAGRMPEVDFINGEIVTLARSHGLKAPVNEALCRLVMEAHRASHRPTWTGEALLAELHRAS